MKTFVKYENKSSGVKNYLIGKDFIKVEFKSKGIYIYTYSTCGITHVENMKELAINNKGLATYINKYKPKFIRG